MRRIIILSIVGIVFLGVVMLSLFTYHISRSITIPLEARSFTITSGETVKTISRELNARGLISNDFWFRTYVWLRKKESSFIAGTFDLPEQVNALSLLHVLTTRGKKEVVDYKILEGWTMHDIEAYAEKQGLFPSADIARLAGKPGKESSKEPAGVALYGAEHPLLAEKPQGTSLEGYLFPDTYELFADASASDLLKKMLDNLEQKVTPKMREDIKAQGKTFYDVLIMASIIEAEVPHEEDRAIISDIFWSRLDVGMALQSDATLNYALQGDSPSLTLEQLQIDSPYNSYKYRGLPPTPIGNPGISAIRAAIYPADTDYLFFLSTPEGKTIFSRTLDEHNAAKARYLR